MRGTRTYARRHGLPLALPPIPRLVSVPASHLVKRTKRHFSCISSVNRLVVVARFPHRCLTVQPALLKLVSPTDQQPFAPNFRLQPTLLLAHHLILAPRPYPPARSHVGASVLTISPLSPLSCISHSSSLAVTFFVFFSLSPRLFRAKWITTLLYTVLVSPFDCRSP